MAEYRPFKCTTWDDPKFQQYSRDARILYIYLWTNKTTSESGVYPISFRTISFYTHLKEEEIKTILDTELKSRIRYDQKNSVVFVVNFLRHNGYGRPELVIRAIQSERAKIQTTLWKDFDKCYPSVSAVSKANYSSTAVATSKDGINKFRDMLQKVKLWDKEERFTGSKNK